MQAYSLDLRTRVIAAYQRGEGSHAQLAQRYAMSTGAVRAWCRRHRAVGAYAPRAHGGGAPRRLTDGAREYLKRIALERNDATLVELRDDLFEHTSVRVSPATICNFLKECRITRKKRHGVQPSVK